jgi:hypothetical protein
MVLFLDTALGGAKVTLLASEMYGGELSVPPAVPPGNPARYVLDG